MKFSDFLDVLVDFLKNPVIYVRSSSGDDLLHLQSELESLSHDFETLKSAYDQLQSRYAFECNVSMLLKDQLSKLEKEKKNHA